MCRTRCFSPVLKFLLFERVLDSFGGGVHPSAPCVRVCSGGYADCRLVRVCSAGTRMFSLGCASRVRYEAHGVACGPQERNRGHDDMSTLVSTSHRSPMQGARRTSSVRKSFPVLPWHEGFELAPLSGLFCAGMRDVSLVAPCSFRDTLSFLFSCRTGRAHSCRDAVMRDSELMWVESPGLSRVSFFIRSCSHHDSMMLSWWCSLSSPLLLLFPS